MYLHDIDVVISSTFVLIVHAPVLSKDQEKLYSASEVILTSSLTIVSCSSNLQFRNACLNSMKVWKCWLLWSKQFTNIKDCVLFIYRMHTSIQRFAQHGYCGCVVQVCDTRQLSTSLRMSLEKVISWKFVSRSRCYSTKVRSVFVLCQNILAAGTVLIHFKHK